MLIEKKQKNSGLLAYGRKMSEKVRPYIRLVPTRKLRRVLLLITDKLFGKMPPRKYFRTVKLGEGMEIKVDIGEQIGSRLYYFGEFERDTYESIRKLMVKGKCFLDIGGNIGLISLMTNQICSGDVEIHIFEPAPDNFELLKTNIEFNGLKNVVMNNVAVADENDTTLTMNIYEDQAYNSLHELDRVSLRTKIEVPVLSIDRYIEKQSINPELIELIKIDVEGYEYNVFEGASKLLSEHNPKILCEISHANLTKSNMSPRDEIDYLLSYGYSCYVYVDGSFRDITSIENCDLGYKYRNFIFSKVTLETQ